MAQFDKSYWQEHWAPHVGSAARTLPANPYLQSETADLHPTTVLDAGCGAGAEAVWLGEQGWQVTAADISAAALLTAQARAAGAGVDERIEWVEADLSRWTPRRSWDLVVTSYAHSEIGQLAFYRRIASWVAPGGRLLIVGHLHSHDDDRRGHEHPEDATATLAEISGLFADPGWSLESGYESIRTLDTSGHSVQLRDVIVRAHRLTGAFTSTFFQD